MKDIQWKMIEATPGEALFHSGYDLYGKAVKAGELLHKPLSFPEFLNKLVPEREGVRCVHLAEEKGRAFASGCTDKQTGKAFVTLVLVAEEERRRGLGRKILGELELRLAREQTELSFFNPAAFPWTVPGKRADHPNTPGVDVASGAYLFFKNCGYRDFAMQNSYYLSLSEYRCPGDMESEKERLSRQGFVFEVYDAERHAGMKEMLRKLGNPLWERELLSEPSPEEGGRRILVPVRDGRVCGFTGPLDVEESGRGYFAGIAVAPFCRGNGLAKVLFCALCEGLKDLGAGYMTLFTGENNPARNIYEAAGFAVVRSWADMRRTKKGLDIK